MKMHHHTDVVLFCVHHLFIVGIAKESKRCPTYAQRRLHNIGNVAFVRLGIKIFQALSGMLLMTAKIIIRTVGNPPELTPAEREKKFKVSGGLGVK